MLRDDGNEEKDVRNIMLSPNMESVYAAHIKHNTRNMITMIVIASRELSHNDYMKLK